MLHDLKEDIRKIAVDQRRNYSHYYASDEEAMARVRHMLHLSLDDILDQPLRNPDEYWGRPSDEYLPPPPIPISWTEVPPPVHAIPRELRSFPTMPELPPVDRLSMLLDNAPEAEPPMLTPTVIVPPMIDATASGGNPEGFFTQMLPSPTYDLPTAESPPMVAPPVLESAEVENENTDTNLSNELYGTNDSVRDSMLRDPAPDSMPADSIPAVPISGNFQPDDLLDILLENLTEDQFNDLIENSDMPDYPPPNDLPPDSMPADFASAASMPAASMPAISPRDNLPPNIPYLRRRHHYPRVTTCDRFENRAQAGMFLSSLIAVTEPLLASRFAPYRHGTVIALIELDPANNPRNIQWASINLVHKTVILRLRKDDGIFYPFESVLSSLLHELANIRCERMSQWLQPHIDLWFDEAMALKYEYNKLVTTTLSKKLGYDLKAIDCEDRNGEPADIRERRTCVCMMKLPSCTCLFARRVGGLLGDTRLGWSLRDFEIDT